MLFRALIVMATIALPAAAQSKVGGNVKAEGDDGFALSDDGRSRLHLGVTAGAGFDTNPYTTPISTGVFGGDAIVRIRPYVDVNVPGSVVAFEGKAQLDYGFLPGIINPDTRSFLLYQSLLSAGLELNRGGVFTFAVGDQVSFNTDPGVAVLGSLLSRVHNTLRAGVGFRPGGGTLTNKLAYTFDFTKFVDIQGNRGLVASGALDSMQHRLQLRSDYRFLPKTGVFVALNAGLQSYPFTSGQGQAFPVGIKVGLQGNLLPRFAFLASLGYSNPIVVDAAGAVTTAAIIGVTGQAEVQWMPLQQATLTAGYRREFSPIALYQYVGEDRFYARVGQLIGQFELGVLGGFSFFNFGNEVTDQVLTDKKTGRFDQHVDVAVALDFHVLKWLSIGLRNNTDYRTTNANVAGDGTNLGFLRNETLLVAAARY